MKRLLPSILLLGSPACIPTPLDQDQAESSTGDEATAGADTDGEGDSSSGASGDDQEVPMGPGVDWSLQLEPGSSIFPMLPSPNGVVVVAQADPLAPFSTIAEYSSTMEPLWSIELPGAFVTTLTAMPDGGYLVGGSEGPDAMAWRLSCCGAVEAAQSFPIDGFGAIVVAQPQAGGLLLARTSQDAQTSFIRTDSALAQEWVVDQPELWVTHGSLTPSGEVVVATYGDDGMTTLYEVTDDGSVIGAPPTEPMFLVGSGPDLTRVTWGYEFLDIQAFDGGPVVNIPAPGLLADHQVARGDRLASTWSNSPEDPIATVLEFDDAGQIIRRDSIPPQHREYLATTAVAYGNDGAIYVAIGESAPEQTYVPMLYRLLPAP